MSNYIEAVHTQKIKGCIHPAKNSVDRLVGLSNLSRYLLGSNTLQDLMDRSVRSIIEILNLDFTRILTLESGGHYLCRITCNKDTSGLDRKHNLQEPLASEQIYHRLAASQPALIPYYAGLSLSVEERTSLDVGNVNHLWLVPLAVNSQEIGFLVLGKKTINEIDRYLIDTTHLVDLIAGQLSNAIYCIRLNDKLTGTSLEMVKALTKTLEARDSESGLHSQHMAGLSQQLAGELSATEKEAQEIYWAALLHDIGKIGIEDQVLRKPGPLTDSEWYIMKMHPEIGAKIVQGLTGLDGVAPLILAHHERLNGSGYPKGLKGDQIPFGARIIAVVDSYTAMVEGRIYQQNRTHEQALVELSRLSGVLYDTKVVKAFNKMINRAI